jgi:hypothetical protein
MGFLDKIKENIQETATMAREGIGDLQTKRELGQAYGELGRKAFDLLESGALQSPELQAQADAVRALKKQLEEEEQAAGGSAPGA